MHRGLSQLLQVLTVEQIWTLPYRRRLMRFNRSTDTEPAEAHWGVLLLNTRHKHVMNSPSARTLP